MSLIQLCSVVVLFIIALSSHFAVAQPRQLTVVADHGGVSAQPYYDSLGLTSLNASDSGHPVSMSASNRKGIESESFIPVRSLRLSPGSVTRRVSTFSAVQAAMQPFFVVGDDPLSRRWLRERYDILKRLNAAGLVVNVESQEALQALQKLAPGITLSAVPGDDLADKLKLDHYPVLVTASGIEQ